MPIFWATPSPRSSNRQRSDDLLDRYAEERQRVFREVTGPTAAENKRRLKESDPEKKRADDERFEKLRDDPQFQREALTFTYKLVGRPDRGAAAIRPVTELPCHVAECGVPRAVSGRSRLPKARRCAQMGER